MKVFAFDLGRVIFDFDYEVALKRLEGKIITSKEEIVEELFFNGFASSYEKGLSTTYEFYEKFKLRFSPSLDYGSFCSIWSEIFSPKEDVINFLNKLSLQFPLYLISNICELHFEYLYDRYPEVFSLFKKLILSYKVKAIKPEEKIYRCLKEEAACEYQDIIYIDDREDLINEAKKLKLNCIVFKNLSLLLSELQNLGLDKKLSAKISLQE